MALADLAGQWQNWTKLGVATKLVDLSGDTLRMILCSGAIPDEDGTTVYGDVTEISAANYTATGKLLANVAVTQDDSGNLMKFTADPCVWAALGAATPDLTFAAIYDDTVGTPVKPVLFIWRIDTQPNGQSFTVNPNASGFATLT